MTEQEWFASIDPAQMLPLLRRKASERKLRLFGVVCCRHFFCDPHGGDDYAEMEILSPIVRVVDGEIGETDFQVVGQIAADLDDYTDHALYKRDSLIALAASPFEIGYVWEGLDAFTTSQGCYPGELTQIAMTTIRDIFGNPFRPVTVDPRWRSEMAVALADSIYAERAFDRMPILADALEDAGCDHADILTHCRGDGPHVRGCWVVDLVLGKE